MPKLSDTQLVILANAAHRDDRAVLALPPSNRANKGAKSMALKALLKRGLITELPVACNVDYWRETDHGGRLALAITDAGSEAAGIDPSQGGNEAIHDAPTTLTECRPDQPAIPNQNHDAAPILRPGTKLPLLAALLGRPDGATIEEIMTATGWQAHSVRGAISGTIRKKLDLPVRSAIEGRGRVYRIAEAG